MGIRFYCPNGHKIHVKQEFAGKRAKCPECSVKLSVPLSSELPMPLELPSASSSNGKLPSSAASIAVGEAITSHVEAIPAIPNLGENARNRQSSGSFHPSGFAKPQATAALSLSLPGFQPAEAANALSIKIEPDRRPNASRPLAELQALKQKRARRNAQFVLGLIVVSIGLCVAFYFVVSGNTLFTAPRR